MEIRAGMLPMDAALRFAASPALTTAAGTETFAELDAEASRLALGLVSVGVQQGDRVGVLSYNRAEVVHAWLGCERAGVVRVVLHSHLDMAAHVQLLNQVGARALLFDVRFEAAVDAHRRELAGLVLVAIGADPPSWAIPWNEVMAAGSVPPAPLDVNEDVPAFIQPTTGTTGAPKPWIVTHRSWAAVVDQNLHHLDTFRSGIKAIGPDDVMLHIHALQWATGFQLLYPFLIRGAQTILLDDAAFEPAVVVDAIVEFGVTALLLPAPMLTPVLDLVEQRGGIEHRLTRLVVFFATPELLERTTALLGPVWCHGFGSTEQGAVTTRLLAEEAIEDPQRLASVGRPASPFFEVAVVDDDGRRRPTGQLGEIVVRSAMSASSYWAMPDRTAKAFLPGGWFRPDDIGYLDSNGFLYYVDRAGDSIRTTDGTVYPHTVETAVLRHPAVANCGVIGLDGDRIVAAIVLKSGLEDNPLLREEIGRSTKPGLAPFEVPEILVVDELPCVLGGAKVQRGVLREQIIAAEA